MKLVNSSGYEVLIDASPNEADLAIASIDENGNRGLLNMEVLKAYGYSEKQLPHSEELKEGYCLIEYPSNKPILFIVTGTTDKVPRNLRNNLSSALSRYNKLLSGKTIWIGLMGLTSGLLTLEQSYELTIEVITNYVARNNGHASFIISIPLTPEGKEFYNQIDISNSQSKRQNFKLAEEFLKNLNCSFFLAGAYWEGDTQIQRFLEQGIWEKGHEDDSYADVINEIKKNDVIILKSAFSSNAESILRVKGMGIVIEPSEDGASIFVDWRIKDISFDIPVLGKYRKTIAKTDLNDVVTIFSFLNPQEWQKLLPPSTTPPVINNKIAGLLNDSEKGIDYLNIDKDVTAFARVIAAKSFDPPLAIALFGKWGSGKSFFMQKLKSRVIDFSERNANEMYCKGVVHINFNAWSYMDANLWASFVSKIFEGLQEYIKQDTGAKRLVNSVKEELSKHLNVTKAGIEIIEEKKVNVEEQIRKLENKKSIIEEEVKRKIASLKSKTAWDVLNQVDLEFNAKDQIIKSLESNNSFVQTESELKKIIPEKYWNNPGLAYQQVKSKYTFLKEFFRRQSIVANLCWATLILLLIFFTPAILDLLNAKFRKINFVIPEIGIASLTFLSMIWRRAEVVYNKLQPIAASFWNIKEDYEKLRDEALAKFQQEEKALTLEIEKGKAEIFLYTEQIQKANIIFEELDFKLNNAFATETLYSFIDERSKSEDYKKHLGIISIIRKDFEILNGLFIDHNSEVVNQQEAEKFRKYFEKPVERIILYVDDLDRCPEENVVQVLEAVNLLMAFPLFIVIVGVDPRWVKNALTKKHSLQFAGTVNRKGKAAFATEVIEPADYLEKIFQVPFHLKDAAPQTVKDMIRKLAESKPVNKSNKTEPREIILEKPFIDISETGDESIISELEIKEKLKAIDTQTATVTESIELIELSNDEVTLMVDMGVIIGSNPRALKRFVNIFKIVKAHEDFVITQSSLIEDLLAVLFLLALAGGEYKKLVPSFEEYISDEKNKNNPIALYLEETKTSNVLEPIRHRLNALLTDNINFQVIQHTKAGIFKMHNAFIRRFTFKNI